MIASRPESAEVPDSVARVANGRALTPVWTNDLGGITFAVGHEAYVKWNPLGNGIDLTGERDRLAWAGRYLSVPEVIEHGRDLEGEWLVSAALSGTNAVTERWKAEPATAVRALGAGLRRLHDSLPVGSCPYSWSTEGRLAGVRSRLDEGLVDFSSLPEGQTVDTSESAWAILEDVPPVERLVVCHGDACAPNTVLADDGSVSGHVDLGSMGVGDPWADLAVASWSTVWNYGSGWERALVDAYGAEPDPEREIFYRLLWALGD